MLLVEFVQWWYGPGWRDSSDRLQSRLHKTYLTFSFPILLHTMFAPWKRMESAPGASIQDRFRAGIDNLISRAVGFAMRLFMMTAAVVIMGGYVLVGGLALALWWILPVLGPALIVAGLVI